jgi:hypothetical protein
MKRFLMSFICLVAVFHGVSQNEFDGTFAPLKPAGSPLFGKDIIINDQPQQNQRNAVFCSSFNGWLFAAYSYDTIDQYNANIRVLRSIDNGITWTTIAIFQGTFAAVRFVPLDLIACGDNLSQLTLFIVLTMTTIDNLTSLRVSPIDGNTGEIKQEILRDYIDQSLSFGKFMDAAIVTDYPFPANSSSPFSFGLLYSKHRNYDLADSIIFRSSSNGGVSFDGKEVIATGNNSVQFGKVALAYGYCPAKSQGRYFGIWEQKSSVSAGQGQIYAAHTEPNFNSPFTTPVRLDNIDPVDANLCRNPVIACQYSNVNNDSTNLTELILFEKYDAVNQRNNIIGYSNQQATSNTYFSKFTLSNPSHNNIQPDICFNNFDLTFNTTYFDSTDLKLPFLTRGLNSWILTSPGYNDASNISAPFPKVRINYGEQKGMNVWVAERISGNGVAMFDAEYSTYTGLPQIANNEKSSFLKAYPNPCGSKVNIIFDVDERSVVSINLFNEIGQKIISVFNQEVSEGRHQISYDVSTLHSGQYICSLTTSKNRIFTKIFVLNEK